MKYPYCLPIIKTSRKDVLNSIQKHKQDYAYFEIYLDYIEDANTTFLEKLADDFPGQLVVVLRRLNLESTKMSNKQQKFLINTLKDENVIIDLDITNQEDIIDYLQSKDYKCQLLVSYHNYKQTPSNEELLNILQQIRKKNPDILKIATKSQNQYDSLRLLSVLLHLKETGQKAIVLGMGEHGVVTRIFGTLWGNELAFAPVTDKEQSAPGQLARATLDGILKQIGDNHGR